MLNISDKENRFLLVYGSATGQAQAIAEDIAEKVGSLGLCAELQSLDETGDKFNLEKEKCVVIITSTTGDGDPPANAEKFMRRIKKRTLRPDYLAHLHYAMLGLGDSNYTNFCRCPRDLDKRLEELGAQRFYPTGLADDGVGLEIVADPWLEGLYPALQNFFGITGENEVSLTETVKLLSLSESGRFQNAKNLAQQKKDNDKAAKNSSGSENDKEMVTSTIDNKESFLEAKSTKENSVDFVNVKNVPFLNSDFTDSTRDCYENKSGNDFDHSTQIAAGILETSQSNDKSDVGTIHSQSVNGATREKALGQIDSEIKVINISDEVTRCLDAITRQKLPVTACVPISLSDVLGCSLSLTCSRPPLSEQTLTIPVLPPPFLSATFSDDPIQVNAMAYQNSCKLPCAASDVYAAQILSACTLTSADAEKTTLLLRLNLEGWDITYSPGDSISVICPNNSSEVELLLIRLGQIQKADATLTLSVIPDTKKRRATIPPHIHPVSTLRHIFTSCVNIREPPSKAFIRSLIEHTSDNLEVRRLQEICSKEGANEYTQFLRESNVSLLDFLYAFPSCMPKVETVLEHLTRLQPRPYSASSYPEATPKSLDIVFNVVKIPANENKGHLYHRQGVCTGWLNNITSILQSGQNKDNVKIPIFLRTNQHFRPPDDLSKPLIMIGPGTGVAPFVGFLQQRALRKCSLTDNQTYGTTWLFYGCRNRDKDFLFRNELNQFVADGVLSNLFVAFSREQPVQTSDVTSPTLARYVQDLLQLHAQDVADLLTDSEALVYVCGDAKNMAREVSGAFETILQKVKGLSPDDAHMFMMKKRIHKTYFEDVWT